MYPSDAPKVQVSWTIIYLMGLESVQLIVFFCISVVERSVRTLHHCLSLILFMQFRMRISWIWWSWMAWSYSSLDCSILLLSTTIFELNFQYCLVLAFINHPAEIFFLCWTEIQ